MQVHHHRYDAVIIGAGGAGLRAAIETAGKARIAVLSKLYPTRSHTGAAQGGVSAALSNVEQDSTEWHTFDTIKGGDYLVDQDAATILCEEAIDAVVELEHFGLPFNRTPDGHIDQRRFGGHTRDHGKAPVRRACYAADRTGHMILQTLYQRCIAAGVNFFNEFSVLDVRMNKDGVRSVIAYEIATGDLHVFATKGVLFATGGFGRMFKVSSNAHSFTGDGPAILYRQGLPLQDMEFFQFHPTGIYKLGILLSEAARGEGGILRNADGERFMERYAPTVKDLAPRDMVARAILQEVREGRGIGPNKDYVHLDLTHLSPEEIDEKLPDITDFVRTYLGIEPKESPIPIQPTAHYAMGGIPTDNFGRVTIDEKRTVFPGLFAAGECACVSVHGANRLGTNSLLDIIVFGKRAGQALIEYVNATDFAPLDADEEAPMKAKLESLLASRGSEKTATLRTELQETLMENASVFRTEDSLSAAQQDVAALRDRFADITFDDRNPTFNYDLLDVLELENLLDLAEPLVAGALARKESRGAHFRDDFPTRDDKKWMKHTLATRDDSGVLSLSYKPVIAGKYEPMERKY